MIQILIAIVVLIFIAIVLLNPKQHVVPQEKTSRTQTPPTFITNITNIMIVNQNLSIVPEQPLPNGEVHGEVHGEVQGAHVLLIGEFEERFSRYLAQDRINGVYNPYKPYNRQHFIDVEGTRVRPNSVRSGQELHYRIWSAEEPANAPKYCVFVNWCGGDNFLVRQNCVCQD